MTSISELLQCLPVNRQVVTIGGRLPGRNEAENAARTHWAVGAKLKRENTELVCWVAKSQHIKPVRGVATIAVAFYEKDLKRDADNVLGGLKYILDGLVMARVLQNDTRKCVDLVVLPIQQDKEKPRIEIYICSKEAI